MSTQENGAELSERGMRRLDAGPKPRRAACSAARRRPWQRSAIPMTSKSSSNPNNMFAQSLTIVRMTSHGTAMPRARPSGRWKETEGWRSGISLNCATGSRKSQGATRVPSAPWPQVNTLVRCCGHPSRLRRREDKQSNPSPYLPTLHLLLFLTRCCNPRSLPASSRQLYPLQNKHSPQGDRGLSHLVSTPYQALPIPPPPALPSIAPACASSKAKSRRARLPAMPSRVCSSSSPAASLSQSSPKKAPPMAGQGTFSLW